MTTTTEKKYFYGNEISEYGLEHGYVDYRALAESFDAVLNNNIVSAVIDTGDIWEIENDPFMDREEWPDVFQWYIVDDNGARILKDANEYVIFNETLDMYVWGVTHYGTAWGYVLTDIKIDW